MYTITHSSKKVPAILGPSLGTWFESPHRMLHCCHSASFNSSLEDEMGRRRRAGKTVDLQPWDM